MCRNDELRLSWLFTKRLIAFCLTRRKLTNPSQNFCYSHSLNFHVSDSPKSVSKQPTQLIVELNSPLTSDKKLLAVNFFPKSPTTTDLRCLLCVPPHSSLFRCNAHIQNFRRLMADLFCNEL